MFQAQPHKMAGASAAHGLRRLKFSGKKIASLQNLCTKGGDIPLFRSFSSFSKFPNEVGSLNLRSCEYFCCL